MGLMGFQMKLNLGSRHVETYWDKIIPFRGSEYRNGTLERLLTAEPGGRLWVNIQHRQIVYVSA